MAGPRNNKRRNDAKGHRPFKKQRRQPQQEYHSSSEDDEPEQALDEQDFAAVNLEDSDDDILNATVDDGADSDEDEHSSSEDEKTLPKKKMSMTLKQKKPTKASEEVGSDGQEDDDQSDEEEDDNEEEDEGDEEGSDDEDGATKTKSKRNDPSAFATSLSKILSTKLSTSKRSDPVLARSAAAHEASKAAIDTALEAKARRQMRDQKRRAKEKGRVKDVLIASNVETSGEPEVTTVEILATEKRLRKTAQRGVVKLFNAVRAAQVTAVVTEKSSKKAGVIGMQNRGERVNEMSKKGFLELIASGGGNLKKGPIEEA